MSDAAFVICPAGMMLLQQDVLDVTVGGGPPSPPSLSYGVTPRLLILTADTTSSVSFAWEYDDSTGPGVAPDDPVTGNSGGQSGMVLMMKQGMRYALEAPTGRSFQTFTLYWHANGGNAVYVSAYG